MAHPRLSSLFEYLTDELVAFRRDLHAHPEIGHTEYRSTQRVAERLTRAGLEPQLLPGTGLICDIGEPGRRTIALRADLDALPLPEETGLPFASTTEGVCHACGHDVHTAALLGAALVLSELEASGRLPGRVRLIFQPAEEVNPGGALTVIANGGLDDVERAYALHCDPGRDVGVIGVRGGPITSASDSILVRLDGPGGHTSRPHVTGDLVFALAQVVTQVPAILSRRLDPRAGIAMVWGRIRAGGAPNAIPRFGEVAGTFRCLDTAVWARAGSLITDAVHEVVAPYGVRAEVTHTRGVPPTVNDADAVLLVEEAVQAELGEGSVVLAEQSLGGEDFAWMLEKVPGAMMRLGTRTPGGRTYDLHQGDLVVDERAIVIGARVLTAIALTDLGRAGTDRARDDSLAG
ncbi:MAG: amidohydrolase [Kineosporiaceae bacterium]